MNHYIDRDNAPELITKLHSLTEEKEIQQFISDNLSGWFIHLLEGYSNDYRYLQDNWKIICDKINTTPKKIVLVDDIKFDKDHTFLQTCCEVMTKRGYVVRRASEFIVCPTCFKAIPCKDIHHLMKEKKLPVPTDWSNKCSSC